MQALNYDVFYVSSIQRNILEACIFQPVVHVMTGVAQITSESTDWT